jgi:ribosomal 50S subunit-associated protein YjgA (DUF615 family)
MFKKSKPQQGHLFKDISQQLSSRKQKLLDDSSSWHNVFYREVVSRVDEDIFSVLYDNGKDRPNAPVKVLLGMVVLKEGQGWSDAQLFDQCRFNLQVMRSLGMFNIDDDVPVESTYYEFKKALLEYQKDNDKDLLKAAFKKITIGQVDTHKVNGKKIRLDSKLINSNIAKSSRLHLILEGLRAGLKDADIGILEGKVNTPLYEVLCQLQENSTSNVTFGMTGKERERLLKDLGQALQTILNDHPGLAKNPQLLKRIFREQYQVPDKDGSDKTPGSPKPKEGKDIPSDSLQSVHDPEATYRKKDTGEYPQKISGYHSNVTETCTEENQVNLIVDVDTIQANKSEAEFLKPTLEQGRQTMAEAGQPAIEEVITDGGYDSIKNKDLMSGETSPQWHLAKTKGKKRAYKMWLDNQGELYAIDQASGETCTIKRSRNGKKYVVSATGRPRRYFTREEVEAYLRHQEIGKGISQKNHNLRANMESTIHQVFHRLKKRNKMVYRGWMSREPKVFQSP